MVCSIVVVVFSGTWLAVALFRKPPVMAVDNCRRALTHAKQLEADHYVPALYASADSSWNEIMIEWKRQNFKWAVTRDFSRLAALAQVTLEKAEIAGSGAVFIRDSLSGQAFMALVPIRREIALFHRRFDALPLSKSIRDRVASTELLVSECQAAYDRRDFKRAASGLAELKKNISDAGEEANGIVQTYMQDLPQWLAWFDRAVAWSKIHNETAVVVDKMGHCCLVYRSGKLLKQYPVEFGPNWVGAKLLHGDGATPEGEYHITGKKTNGFSKYHKALELDYPNSADRARFKKTKIQGRVAASAWLGGNIELHGNGGKGANWTEGCVALCNTDIDELFGLVKVGTPVTIIGARRPFDSGDTVGVAGIH